MYIFVGQVNIKMIGRLFFFPLGPASIEGSPARGNREIWASFARFYTSPPRLTRSRCLSFNRTLGYLQRVSSPQIFRESRRRIEDITEPKKEEKKGKQILCFRTKTAHIEQSLFDPIGPFSYVRKLNT